MCPTASFMPAMSLFSLEYPLPVVVPFCDEGYFMDEMIIEVRTLSRPVALPSINCSQLTPVSCDTDSLSPSTPDSGFSSDDGCTSPTSPTRLERSKTLTPVLRKHRVTVARKKSVHFADSVGLDLEKLQYFTKDEDAAANAPSASQPHSTSHRLCPMNFIYRSESDTINRTRACYVNVSSLRTTPSGHLTGQINVLNVAYNKQISIRYTLDNWTTFSEITAAFSHKVCNTDDIDAFSFILSIQHKANERCEMCVSYTVGDEVFWDNNTGANYVLEWIAREEKPVSETTNVISRLPRSHQLRYTFDDDDCDSSLINKLPARTVPSRWRSSSGGKFFESAAFI